MSIVDEVMQELVEAQGRFPEFHSAHEGYAIILEELRELEREVFSSPRTLKDIKERRAAMHGEAKQLAAMAIRFMYDVTQVEDQ